MDPDANRAGPSRQPFDSAASPTDIQSFNDEEQDQVYPLPTLQAQADTQPYSMQPQPDYQTQTQIREPSPRPLSGASSSTHGYATGGGSATGSVRASPPPAPPSKDDHADQLEYLDQDPARMTPPVPQITVVPYTPPTLQTSVSVPSSPPPIVPPRPDSLQSLQPPSQTQTQQYQINTVLPPVQPYVQPYNTQPLPQPQPQRQSQAHIRTPVRTPTTTPRVQNQNPGAYIPAPAEPYTPYVTRRSPSPIAVIRGTNDDGRYPSPTARPASGAYSAHGHGHAGSASGSGSGNASPVGPGAAPYAGPGMSMPGAYDPPAGPPPFTRAVSYSTPASAAMPARPPRAMSYAERPPTGRSSRYNSLNGNGNGNGNGSVTGYGGGMGSAGGNGNGSAMAGGMGLGDATMRRSVLDHTVPVVHEDGSMVSTVPTGKVSRVAVLIRRSRGRGEPWRGRRCAKNPKLGVRHVARASCCFCLRSRRGVCLCCFPA